MSKKAKANIAYSGIALAVLYFMVVAGYFMTKIDFLYRLWEAVTIMSAPIILMILISILEYAEQGKESWKIAAIAFMICTTVVTAIAHYPNIIAYREITADFQPNDSLAWGFFMGFSFIFTSISLSPKASSLRHVKSASMICGCLCLVGLLGPILNIIPLWFIAVAGYGFGTPVICIFMLSFYKNQP